MGCQSLVMSLECMFHNLDCELDIVWIDAHGRLDAEHIACRATLAQHQTHLTTIIEDCIESLLAHAPAIRLFGKTIV